MQRISTCALLATVLLLSNCVRSVAGPFVNLNFEQSTVQPTDPIVVPTGAAFPGWTAWFGNTASNNVYHDYDGAGEPIVAIYDQEVQDPRFRLLQGSYMAYLAPSTSDLRTALSQFGDIPAGTQSMTLLCDGAAGSPIVKINGTLVPMIRVSGSTSNHTIATWGGDVSAFAGTMTELRFESGPFNQLVFIGRRAFDDVRFSQSPLPEPTSTTTLLFVGALLLRRSRRSDSADGRPVGCRHR